MQISKLKNLGPRSEAALRAVGIESAEALCAQDAFDLYARLKQSAPDTSLNMLYALLGAQEDLHWQIVRKERRMEIVLELERRGLLKD